VTAAVIGVETPILGQVVLDVKADEVDDLAGAARSCLGGARAMPRDCDDCYGARGRHAVDAGTGRQVFKARAHRFIASILSP
jgi:hypothetical protein